MNRSSAGLFVAVALLGLAVLAWCAGALHSDIPTLNTPRLPQLRREIPMPSHLLAHLPMRGNASDVSGNNHHGLVIGARLTADRFGRADRAYDFSGRGAYIELADERAFDLHTFTIAMQVRISSWPAPPTPEEPGRYTLISKGEHGGNFTLELTKSAGEPSGRLSYSQRTLTGAPMDGARPGSAPAGVSAGPFGLYQFHHVAVTAEGPVVRLYLDGQLKGEKTDVDPRLFNDAPVLLGRSASAVSSNWFSGVIDDVRIYTRALSAPEIYDLMAEPENE